MKNGSGYINLKCKNCNRKLMVKNKLYKNPKHLCIDCIEDDEDYKCKEIGC